MSATANLERELGYRFRWYRPDTAIRWYGVRISDGKFTRDFNSREELIKALRGAQTQSLLVEYLELR